MSRPFAPLQHTRATIALRRWLYDRTLLLSGKVTNYERIGWQKRANASYDARQVRVVDFELALQTLPAHTQTLLILAYANGYSNEETSAIMGISPSTVYYQIPRALDALACALERRSLL
jgi:DNA-directed RNA polymerase specialized sigma24 family protein